MAHVAFLATQKQFKTEHRFEKPQGRLRLSYPTWRSLHFRQHKNNLKQKTDSKHPEGDFSFHIQHGAFCIADRTKKNNLKQKAHEETP